MSANEKKLIWLPQLSFKNCKTNANLQYDQFSLLEVLREGPPEEFDKSDHLDNLIFSGKDNPFYYIRMYDLQLVCEFQLQNYPFDTQTCSLEVRGSVSKSLSANIDRNCALLENLKSHKVKDFRKFSMLALPLNILDSRLGWPWKSKKPLALTWAV